LFPANAPGRDVPVKGKPVRRRRGPAAVSGNGAFPIVIGHCPDQNHPGGKAERTWTAHEPEDLAGT